MARYCSIMWTSVSRAYVRNIGASSGATGTPRRATTTRRGRGRAILRIRRIHRAIRTLGCDQGRRYPGKRTVSMFYQGAGELSCVARQFARQILRKTIVLQEFPDRDQFIVLQWERTATDRSTTCKAHGVMVLVSNKCIRISHRKE